VLAGTDDLCHLVRLGRAQRIRVEQLVGVAEYTVERCAQLVAQRGEKARFLTTFTLRRVALAIRTPQRPTTPSPPVTATSLLVAEQPPLPYGVRRVRQLDTVNPFVKK
jgi:hypothetical protein